MFGLVGFVVWVWGVDRLVVVCFGFWWLVYCYGINFRVLFRLVDLFGWVDCVFFGGLLALVALVFMFDCILASGCCLRGFDFFCFDVL